MGRLHRGENSVAVEASASWNTILIKTCQNAISRPALFPELLCSAKDTVR